jgi:antirestriction protein ArdC
VFHASQIDGIPAFVAPTVEQAPWRRPKAAEVILRNSAAVVRYGGERAFYSPGTDHIQLPPDHAFIGPAEWAATLLHELSHWSGHSSRLNRDLKNRFGSEAYAAEERRAELSSVFIGAEVGLPCDIPNHASYLASWITALKADKREIFRAASDAQKIADYVLAFHPEYAGRVLAAADPEPEAAGETAHVELARPAAVRQAGMRP